MDATYKPAAVAGQSAGPAAVLRKDSQDYYSLYELTRGELGRLVGDWGFSPSSAGRLWRYLYRQAAADWDAMHQLPPRLRARLAEKARIPRLMEMSRTVADGGATEKFVLGLADGQRIETVLMRCRGRITACLSSQAGCPLGCVFCATGQAGFARNFTAGEIVAQALYVARALGPQARLRNIVLMGMGEPLLNYDAVMRAAEILGDGGGLAIAGKRLTLSTVGVIPGIVRLADDRRPCSLAVSLHAATQAERAQLVPAARTWPLDELIDACRYYCTTLQRRIFFEWTLIAGVNDSPDHARQLAQLVRGLPVQINLIPLNATAGYAGSAGTPDSLHRFHAALRDAGPPVSVRRRRGDAIAAACGQLAGCSPA